MIINKRRLTLIASFALTISAIGAAVYAQHQTGTHAQHTGKSAASQDCPAATSQSNHGADKSGAAQGKGSQHGHGDHLAAVNERGEKAMGFSQTRTTHHFLLQANGGLIEVEANEASDTVSRDQIRNHLAHIARAFAAGDFQMPLAVHEGTPPGLHEMCRLKAAIKYDYEETERGGRVRIRTDDGKALAAVHDFLRFQIKDHQTGDKLEVSN
jgi:hypothetical protein